jgi:hypothetical protein
MRPLVEPQLTSSRAARLAGGAGQWLFLVLACTYLGLLASEETVGKELLGLAFIGLAVAAIAVPPHIVLASVVLVMGASSVFEEHPIDAGGALVYAGDLLLVVVLLRAVVPRERVAPPASLGSLARVLFAALAAVMILAGARAALEGHDLVSILRLETPLIYAVGFYLGLGRVVRERGLELDKAVRSMLIAALALVAYMAVARAANAPFETEETVGRLGPVMTTGGEVRRDFGFASAFIVYPVLALGAAAYLLFGVQRKALAATLLAVGASATLATLIRGEIFGLFVGLAVIAVLRNDAAVRRVSRVPAIVVALTAFAIAGASLWAVDAPLARGIVERSLPGFVQQTSAAESTADYRRQAIAAGVEAAARAPLGVGLVSADRLEAISGVDLGHLAHSGITTMLVYGGWLGLVAAVLALASLVWASFRQPRPVPWLHPFFVGTLVMLTIYSVAAAGLAGQSWVIGLAALVAALRFNASGETRT